MCGILPLYCSTTRNLLRAMTKNYYYAMIIELLPQKSLLAAKPNVYGHCNEQIAETTQ